MDVTDDTAGYPFFIQFFAKEILDAPDKDAVGPESYSTSRGVILKKLWHEFFSQRMAVITSRQGDVLRAMASIKKPLVELSDIQGVTGMSKGSVNVYLSRMIESGMVYKSGPGSYGFVMPLMGELLESSP